MKWLQQLFGVSKPIIALLHLRALPGDPLFSRSDSIDTVLRHAREELLALQEGGVDGVLVANEFSLPYEKKVSPVTVAAMAYLVGAMRCDIQVPFGVNIVSNPIATIDLAAATGAHFVRSTFTGAYIGESGLVDTDIASTLRRKKALGLDDLKLLYKVNPESDAYIAERDIEKITKSMLFHCFPDGLCVSGASAGTETDSSLLTRVKQVSGDTPVFCNTGCTIDNITQKLQACDGACVGTAFKKDGKFNEFVEPQRVKDFMDQVKAWRAAL